MYKLVHFKMNRIIPYTGNTWIYFNAGQIIYIIVFDLNDIPITGYLFDNSFLNDISNGNINYKAFIKYQDGILIDINMDSSNFTRALEISRQFRPGFGRTLGALLASISIKFSNYSDFIRCFYDKGQQLDVKIRNSILTAFNEKHHNNNTEKPRFIIIPYFTNIRTKSLSYCSSFNHYVTLIVDLCHKKDNEYKPIVYVYDSAHTLCNYYGVFSFRLNKENYFQFGPDILVDDEPLNNDINISPHLFCLNMNKSSKIQYLFRIAAPLDLRCGYFCEAAINLLLSNTIFINFENNIQHGRNTRMFLKSILRNGSIFKVLEEEIKPPWPFELCSN